MRLSRPAPRRPFVRTALCAATALACVAGLAPSAAADGAATVTTWATAGSISVGSSPRHIALDPISHRAFIATNDGGGAQLNVINTATNAALPPISEQVVNPTAVVVDPTSHTIYASSFDDGTIAATDEDGTAEQPLTIPHGYGIRSMSLDAANHTLYATGYDDTNDPDHYEEYMSLFALDLTTGATSTVASLGQYFMSPPSVVVDAAAHRAYFGTGSYAAVDLTTGAIVATSSLGNDVAVDPTRHTILAASSNGTVSILDTQTNHLLVTLPVGGEPSAISVDSSAGVAFVTNATYNSVSVIDEDSLSVVATVPVDLDPVAMAVDSTTHDAYALNYGVNTVSVIHKSTQPGSGGGAGSGSGSGSGNPGTTPQVVRFTSKAPHREFVHNTYQARAVGGGSGNRVVFSADPRSYGKCFVSARGVVAFGQAGTCIIDADQNGSGSFADAPTARLAIRVYRHVQTITFPTLRRMKVGRSQALRATTNAHVQVTYSVRTPQRCWTSAGRVHAKSAGRCVVVAHAARNTVYAAAKVKTRTVTVS